MNDTMRNELKFLATGRRPTGTNTGLRALAKRSMAAVYKFLRLNATEELRDRVVAAAKGLHASGMNWVDVDEEMFGVRPLVRSELVAKRLCE